MLNKSELGVKPQEKILLSSDEILAQIKDIMDPDWQTYTLEVWQKMFSMGLVNPIKEKNIKKLVEAVHGVDAVDKVGGLLYIYKILGDAGEKGFKIGQNRLYTPTEVLAFMGFMGFSIRAAKQDGKRVTYRDILEQIQKGFGLESIFSKQLQYTHPPQTGISSPEKQQKERLFLEQILAGRAGDPSDDASSLKDETKASKIIYSPEEKRELLERIQTEEVYDWYRGISSLIKRSRVLGIEPFSAQKLKLHGIEIPPVVRLEVLPVIIKRLREIEARKNGNSMSGTAQIDILECNYGEVCYALGALYLNMDKGNIPNVGQVLEKIKKAQL